MQLFKSIGLTVMALLVLLSSTGVNIFEHSCNTEHLKFLSLVKIACKDDSEVKDCCKATSSNSNHKPTKKRNCCENKLFFVKSEIQNYYTNLLEKKINKCKQNTQNSDFDRRINYFPEHLQHSLTLPFWAYNHPPFLNNCSFEILCIMRC